MAVIQCQKCGYKALRQLQRSACPVCETPYDFSEIPGETPSQAPDIRQQIVSGALEEGFFAKETASILDEEHITNDDEAGTGFTPFETRVISAIESMLAARYWEDARVILEKQQEVLLADEGHTFLQKLSAAHHDAESEAIAEHLDMYLDVFEDAMEHNNDINGAWQRFQSNLQLITDALKELALALVKGDIRPIFEERRDLLLSASTFAALYRGMHIAGTDNTDLGKSILLFLRIFYAARADKLPTPEQLREMLNEVGEQLKQKGHTKFTMMPGVPGVDPNDPQTALLIQEMTNIGRDQPELLKSFMTEGVRWSNPSASGLEAPEFQDEGIPHMRELATQLLKHVSREEQPHFWATLQTVLETCDLASPEPSSSPDYLNYDPPFSYEEAPDQWAQAIALRGFRSYQRTMGEHNQDTEQAIAHFTKALSVLTYERNPGEWAAVLNVRGIAYMDRKEGEPIENIKLTIADLDTVLALLEREEYPMPWAMTTSLRCTAYSKLFYLTNERHLLERVIADSEMLLSVFEQLGRSVEWAESLCTRGAAYAESSEGDQQKNLKTALADFEAAATVLTREEEPDAWSRLQASLGITYLSLFVGDRNQNLENALASFNAALSVLTRETSPVSWARTVMNRGMASNALMTGDRKQNQENALVDFDASLEVFSERRMSIDLAKGLVNRGGLYLERIAGERRTNYELAEKDCTNALRVLTRERAPALYGMTLVNRGMAYRKLAFPEAAEIEQDFISVDEMFKRFLVTSGPAKFTDTYMHYVNEYQRFTKLAIADFDEALTVLTPEDNPREWAHACRIKATLGYGILDFGSYEEQAARHYDAALSVFTQQSMPIEWATTLSNRATYYLHLVLNGRRKYVDRVLADLDACITVFTREIAPNRYRGAESMRAQLFMVLHRWQEAHEALLKVRAVERDLITNALDTSAQFDTAAEFSPIDIYLRHAQVLVHLQRPQKAVVALEEGRARSLRIALDADTLDPARISDPAAKQRANNFLAARDDLRILQRSAIERMQAEDNNEVKDTSKDIEAITQAHMHFLQARDAIRQYDNPDFMAPIPTWERIGRALSSDDEALVYLATDVQDGDDYGMALIVTQNKTGVFGVTHLPLPHLTRNTLSDLFEPGAKETLSINVERALQSLGHTALDKIVQTLLSLNVHKVRLIPHGRMGLFPLPSVSITLPGKKKRPLGEIFEVTLVPSARALEIAHERMHIQTLRTHLLMAGNPQPLSSEWEEQPLPFAAAEAEVSFHIARKHGHLPANLHYLRPEEVTRQNVVEELQRAWYAHLATHGRYNVEEPQNSQVILAGKESLPEVERTISLREALDGSVDLVGLRLLVLSACETSVFDIRRAPNEVAGLAAGFLQAGAVGVLATLWKVGEAASYLLMSRFAELYLNPGLQLAPAQALAQAQHWLHVEATNSILQTYKPDLMTLLVNRLSPTHQNMLALLRKKAAEQPDPHACMYADPQHWAAFIVTGC